MEKDLQAIEARLEESANLIPELLSRLGRNVTELEECLEELERTMEKRGGRWGYGRR